MVAKHTPGPWTSTDYDEGFVEVFYKPFGLGVIARCYGDDRMANAALIARAPELLAENERLAAECAELRGALQGALSYLADLNGSEWIKGDDVGAIDMRQRAKGQQARLFAALAKKVAS